MSFVDTVLFHGRLFPRRPAIMTLDRVVTYGMLGDAIHAVSARVLAAGVKPGDRVLLAIDNPVRFVAVAFALMRLGIVIMPIAPGSALAMPMIDAVALIGESPGLVPAGMRMIVAGDEWFQPSGAAYAVDPGASDPNRLAIIAPTSGTTGTTKLIPLSVGEFDRRLHDLYRYQPAPGTERDLMLVGFTSLWALSQSARTLVAARTLGVASSAEDALRMIDLYQMGTILGSPNQLAAMIAALDAVPASLTSLRLVKCGGGQVTPSFARTIRERLCQNLLVIYGSTEAGRTAMANGAAIDSVPGCVGWVIPGRSLEIVDDAGAAVPAGTVGRVRILIEGGGRPLLGSGIEADTTPDWFYPGDLGHVTDDGMLVIVGRADDVINAGGTKVAPERVEELVAGHPAVAEAVAFARTDGSGIAEIWLAIVPREPVSAEAIIAHCRSRSETLAPRRILFLETMPRAALGKPDRARLRALAAR